MQFQSIIFMASPQNSNSNPQKIWRAPWESVTYYCSTHCCDFKWVTILLHIILSYWLFGGAPVAFSIMSNSNFCTVLEEVAIQCAENEKIVQWVGNDNPKASFSLFSSYCCSLWYFRITGRHCFWKSTWKGFSWEIIVYSNPLILIWIQFIKI